MLEETGWRRRLWRKVLSWLLYVTPCRCTRRALMLWSRLLSPRNTHKVLHIHTHCMHRWSFLAQTLHIIFCSFLSSQCTTGWASESPPTRRLDLTEVSLLHPEERDSSVSCWNSRLLCKVPKVFQFRTLKWMFLTYSVTAFKLFYYFCIIAVAAERRLHAVCLESFPIMA